MHTNSNASFPHSVMKKEIITVAGMLGAGKSSTAKLLAKELGYRHFSSGDMFRDSAREHGLTVEELNVAEVVATVDREVDARLRALGEEEKIVIDSRLAYHWIPGSYKVYLNLDTQTAAERTFNHIRTEGRVSQSADSVENLVKSIQTRKENERKRYLDLYQVDLADLSSFDLVVDTAEHDLDGVVQIILEQYRKFLAD